MSSDSIRSVILGHRIHADIIRRSLTGPSELPMEDREKVAEHIIGDMLNYSELSKNTINGTLGERLRAICNDDWKYLKEVSKENSVLSSFIAASVISRIVGGVSDDMDVLRNIVSSTIDTANVLESIFPGDDFERYADEIYDGLLFSRDRYSDLIEKRDILSWIGETMRFLESELQNSDKEEHGRSTRNVRILMDTSKSMFGEPEVISKALMLSLAKRMMSDNRSVHVSYRSDSGTVSFDLDEKDHLAVWLLDVLAYRFRSTCGINVMLDDAMTEMKQGVWNDTDLIVISKGLGVRNSMRFTTDWETFKGFNNIRTFSIAAGSMELKGLTELSDHTYPMNGAIISGMKGEYAKLISDLKR